MILSGGTCMKTKLTNQLIGVFFAVALMFTGTESLVMTVSAEGPQEPPQGEPGQMPDGAPGEKPDGAPGEPPEGGMSDGGMPGGSQSAVTEWDSVIEYSEDTETSEEQYDSTGTDENAVLVSDGTAVLNQPVITRTSAESQGGDNASFYGVGAAVLTTGGTAVINGGTITTDANGAAGVFAYSDGIAYVSDTVIRTSGNTAGGIHAAGGGTLYAWNLDVETQGESSAAIRSDRGGGTMVVDGGSYVTNGEGSPAVYVTADISVKDAELAANESEGICIEGRNTLRLFNTDLTSDMKDLSQNDHTWSVILYQSMSGDSEEGNSAFYMIDGSLTSKNGGLFYSTNTESEFYLENVTISAAEDCEYFLRVSGNANQRGWGTTGQNGADTDFTAVNQVMNGDVIWDSISNLDFYMAEGSVLTGAVIDDESYAGEGGDGYASLYIDASSKWIVTGDSRVTNLYCEGSIVDEAGNTVTVAGIDGTVYVQGESTYTVTVDSYSAEADLSGMTSSVSWQDYEADAPDSVTISDAEIVAEETKTTESAAEETEEQTEINQEKKAVSTVALIAAAIAILLLAGFLFSVLKK